MAIETFDPTKKRNPDRVEERTRQVRDGMRNAPEPSRPAPKRAPPSPRPPAPKAR